MESVEDRIAAGHAQSEGCKAETDQIDKDGISAFETDAVSRRRKIAGIHEASDGSTPTIGLAFSGGGIRSATFCLGLLRGLACNGVLKRFDYLSTVSGGGYIGAMFGRLVERGDIHQAESILARSDTATLSWLRRYGRYLAPGGARDYGIGFATYLRAALAMHLEFAAAALGIAALMILVHLAILQGMLDPTAWGGWKSVLLPLACLSWMVLAPGLIAMYWLVPKDRPTGRPNAVWLAALALLMLLAAGTVAWRLLLDRWPFFPITLESPWQLLALLALAGVALRGLGLGLRLLRALLPGRDGEELAQAELRRRLTVGLRRANVIALGLAGMGMVDWLGWELYDAMIQSRSGLFGSLGAGGLVLLAARALNSKMSELPKSGNGRKATALPMLINAVGFGLTFALLVGWTAVAQWAVFGAGENNYFARLGCLALPPAVWFIVTLWFRDSVNASSLHPMYCARLVRAYLGAANPARFNMPLATNVAMDHGAVRMDVTELHPGDDVPLANYDPPAKGGPIHLINVCLNQTRAADTGLYNADRKGVPLVVNAYEARAGCRTVPVPVAKLGTLGRWVAISGAVASPGAGARTTPGWAALLFLAGVRVGYWLDVGKAHLPRESTAARPALGQLRRAFAWTKFGRLHAEFTASFHGPFVSDWHLSDGGHFDNTGVHALLQRRLDFIVLADCGADPRYEFADLENLVRKARIDYGADIEFYTVEAATALLSAHVGDREPPDIGFLSLETMHDNATVRGVLCARILYRADSATGQRTQGLLLVVKPNLHQALDLDLQAYARRHQDFPQQATGDQFFDEMQWESYRRLGEDFGMRLRPDWLSRLPGWSSLIVPETEAAPVRGGQPSPPTKAAETSTSVSPFWRIGAQGAAVGLLSVGALTALYTTMSEGVAKWQQARETARSDLSTVRGHLEALEASSRQDRQGGDLDVRQIETIEVFRDRLRKVVDNSGQAIAARKTDRRIRQDCTQLAGISPKTDVAAGHVAFCKAVTAQAGRIEPPASRYWTLESPITSVLDWTNADASIARQRKKAEAENASPSKPPVPLATAGQATPLIDAETITSIRSAMVAKGLDADGVFVIDRSGRVQSIPQIRALTMAADVVETPEPLPVVADPSAKAPPPSAFVPLRPADACARSRPIELYVQVYDEAMRKTMMKQLAWTAIGKQVHMPGVENVVTTARARGVAVGGRYDAPTLRVHRMEPDEACARAIATWVVNQPALAAQGWSDIKVLPLPRGYAGRPGVIELWWPSQAGEAVAP